VPVDVAAWYQAYGPMVLRRCRSLLVDEELARDAMQEVFVNLVRRANRLDDRAPSSLLYRMATNQCLNTLRSKRRKPEHLDQEMLERIALLDDPAERIGAKWSLARLFSGQKESTRVIAVLHYVDGMTLQEVADEVGMSVSGIRKRLRGLRASLGEWEAA